MRRSLGSARIWPYRDQMGLSMTPELTAALEAPRLVAAESRAEYVRPVHLLVGALAPNDSGARQILLALQIDVAELIQRARTVAGLGSHEQPDPGRIPYDRAALQT